ncbi:MAG: enterochelin esterase [Planctomycetes bacterium]|nr:enterochelin esterase [Planctomycetota bacterium]
MSLAIETFLETSPVDKAAVDAFVAAHEFPLVEGSRVTFVYRGEADSVLLQHWIYGLESARPFKRVEGTNLWHLVVEIPEGSRVEYKFVVERGQRRELIRDPLNPHLAHDPYGSNSVAAGEGYERPDWTLPDPEARPGSLERRLIRSEALGEVRPIQVYVPARFRSTRRYPLLVVHDGADYLRFSSLQTVLDNLIHRLEIPPLVVALTTSTNRLYEYADDERHARFVVDELLPLMTSAYPLVDKAEARALMGASFGAVAALSTAWRHQGVFGNLLLQSGSFAFTDIGQNKRGPLFEPVVEFVNALRKAPGRPADKLFVSCGVYESLIYENRSLVPLLQHAGMAVRFVESRDGHNWENWRDRLREGLSWLFPGPLWMVYE